MKKAVLALIAVSFLPSQSVRAATKTVDEGMYTLVRSSADVDLNSACGLKVEIFSDAGLIKMTPITNQTSQIACQDKTPIVVRCGFDSNRCEDSKYSLRFHSPTSFTLIQSGDTPIESDYTWVGSVEKPATVFAGYDAHGWWTITSEDVFYQQCSFDDKSAEACKDITFQDLKDHGFCERADQLALDGAMSDCKNAGYTRCEVQKRDWSFVSLIKQYDPKASRAGWLSVGCNAYVQVSGVSE